MKKLKTQKGITLIALVITIIVMLILVAVTINMAINGGLFEKAGKATGDTRNAMNAEQALASGQITIDGKTYASIDDYLAGNPLAEHNWTRTGDTFTCSHCNATYEMGQVVDYTAKGKTSTTISAVKSGLNRYVGNTKYPPGANVDSNGTQTIEAQSTEWVVLGIEDTNGDKIYETLLITTENTDGNIYFYGAAGYNNAASYIGANGKKEEGEIDRICRELYSNSEYGGARGMTIKDVNSALNYEPIGGYYFKVGETGNTTKTTRIAAIEGTLKTTGNLTTKLKDIEEGTIFNSLKANGTYTPEGTEDEEALGEYELNGYWYWISDDGTMLTNEVNDTTSAITEVERNTIFGPSNNYSYWLASRGVSAEAHFVDFGPGTVNFGLASSCYSFFHSNGNGASVNYGLRPVVSLKSKLPTVVE